MILFILGGWRILLPSEHCGGKNLCRYQVISPGVAWRLSALFRPVAIWRAALKQVKVSFTCLMICLDEETRCQEQLGETVQGDKQESPSLVPGPHTSCPHLPSPASRLQRLPFEMRYKLWNMPDTSQITHSKPVIPIYMRVLICYLNFRKFSPFQCGRYLLTFKSPKIKKKAGKKWEGGGILIW